MMHDLAIIIVSIPGQPHWLGPCLASVHSHAGNLDLEVVVADNGSTVETRRIASSFGSTRVVECVNRGFAHANNRALMTYNARYVLFLNPDTEVLSGTFEEIVRAMDDRGSVGLAGVKQVTPAGELFPTIRRAPNALRALGEAVGSEKFPFHFRWLGERELDLSRYGQETACDWTSGSFMLVRREALESAGFLDERFFLYAEETDLCLRVRKAGWEVRHLPSMTILHHADKADVSPRMEAQGAFARTQYAAKNFSPAHRHAYVAAMFLKYGLRASLLRDANRRRAARAAIKTLLGHTEPPFGSPPPTAMRPRSGHSAPDLPAARTQRSSEPASRGVGRTVQS